MGRLKSLLGLASIGLVIATLAALVPLTDSAWLSRHSDRADRPWALRKDGLSEPKEVPFNAAFSDKVNLIWPDAEFLAQARADGEPFPLWNPLILGGVPTGANPLTQTFYPLQLTGWTGHVFHGLVLQAALHLLLGALFFFLWMRGLGIGRGAALISAFSFAFCGWVTAHLHNTPIVSALVWVPLGLFAVDRFLSTRKAFPLLWLALSVAMQWLAGMPQLAVLGSSAIAIYAFIGWLKPLPGGSRRIGRGALLASAAILGLLASGPQLTTILEASEVCGHQGKNLEARLLDSYPEGAWVGLALPRTLGGAGNEFRPLERDWKQHWIARALLSEGAGHPVPQIANWSERTIYPGIVVLLLALLGIWQLHRPGVLRIALFAAFGVILASSAAIIEQTQAITGFKEGAPARGVALLCLAIPAFAARGLHWLSRHQRHPLLILAGAIIFAFGLTAIVLALSEERRLDAVLFAFREMGILEAFGVAGESRETLVGFLKPELLEFRLDLIALAVLLPATGIALLFARKLGRVTIAALALLIAIDLLVFFVPPNRPVPRRGLYRPTPALSWLQDSLGDGRILRVSKSEPAAWGQAPLLYVPNLGIIHGIRDAQGWREQVPQYAIALWRGTAARVAEIGVSGLGPGKVDSPIPDLMRVTHFIGIDPIPALAEHRVDIPGQETLHVYENRDAMPVAWLVPQARKAGDEEAARVLASPDFDPRARVLLSEESTVPTPPTGFESEPESLPEVEITGRGRDHWTFEVDAPAESWLVVSETWYPGWKATVRTGKRSEREAEVHRANLALRAVRVPAGQSEVHLEFAPDSVRYGVGLTILAGLVTLGICAMASRRGWARLRNESQTEKSDPHV